MEPPQSPPSDAGRRPPGEGAGAGAPAEIQPKPGSTDTQPTPPLSAAERTREARARRRRAIRQFLIVGLCFAALLCLGAVAVGFLYYDRATKPDLSTPEHVTRKYLEAYLIDRDELKASKYRCSDASALDEIRALRADIDDRQRRFGATYSFSVDRVNEISKAGDEARMAVDLILSMVSEGQSIREVEHWEVTARNENGWRVCGAHETD